jgi:glycosyltransferase involved in cell wall biosynthesis
MTHLLIVTHEHIGPKMAGPGIRAWEIARAVARHGFSVVLATPYPEFSDSEGLQVVGFSWDDPFSLEQWFQKANVVMAIGPLLSRIVHWLGKPIEQPVIADLYDISQIEQILLFAYSGSYFSMLVDILIEDALVYLSQGDFFVCATERQRDFWLGTLWMAGRLNASTLSMDPERWIATVPMGLPDVPPTWTGPVLKGVIPGIGPQDKVVLWMGGLWEWTDPLTLAAAIEQVLTQRQDVRWVFGSLHHYDEQVVPKMSKAARFLERCQNAGWLGRYVFFLDWIPYAQRGAYLLEADLGIGLYDHLFESRYAIRARTLDYLWASLPCVLSVGDEMANLLGAHGLAALVPPRDSQSVADAILRWLDSIPSRAELKKQVLPLQNTLRWSVVVEPIVTFLKHPCLAPDAERARRRIPSLIGLRRENDELRRENDELRRENDELRRENDELCQFLENLKKGRVVRLLNRVYHFFGRTFL